MAAKRSTGSEWRKWDLHIHAPDTRLENKYKKNDEHEPDWDRFCKIIHESDVLAIGITDYFSLDSFFTFKEKYDEQYPHDQSKVFFPNLELRLNHAVHKNGAEVNIHLILPPTLSRDDADLLLYKLELFNKPSGGDRNYTCAEAKKWPSDQLKSASTTLDSIRTAIMNTFDGANSSNLEDYALILVSGRDDGVSPGGGVISPRKEAVIDIIDEGIHALFSRGADSNYWLKKDRIDSQNGSVSRPTFGGCDAHDFDGLEKMLGKTGNDKSRHWETTWVKADLSWEGLLQTLAEPESRVKITELKPDAKDDYRVIKAVEFDNDKSFPSRVEFNSNLNAIIGSRSSGKSSLLAHIAFAVDSDDTQRQQEAAGVNLGPAAGHSWKDVPSSYCRVIWNGEGDRGRVVYIPQNFLNELSSDPDQVTRYILPSVKRLNPELYGEYESFLAQVSDINAAIESLTTQWFEAESRRVYLEDQLVKHGDEKAIQAQIAVLDTQIGEIRQQSNLTEDDAKTYREIKQQLAGLDLQITRSRAEASWLKEMTETDEEAGVLTLKPGAVDVVISFKVPGANIPDSLNQPVEDFLNRARGYVHEKFLEMARDLVSKAESEETASSTESESVQSEHQDLFKRFAANTSISKLEEDRKSQETSLKQRQDLQIQQKATNDLLDSIVKQISSKIDERDELGRTFVERFNKEVEGYGGLYFGVEEDYDGESLIGLRDKFDRSVRNPYIDGRSDDSVLDITKIQSSPGTVLRELGTARLKIKRAENPRSVAQALLTESKDLRFWASLDGDIIGGFKTSTMTPGKQSLFALTLILSDAGEDWPLLIDQPEDDLDSRSIYNEIVEFLKKQKQRRQILMVTHNANLVVGADAECVIVANRHGDDRKNIDDRTFDYMSGALENTFREQKVEYELKRQGIREHVVELLDGGSDAFRKRKEKYKL